MKSRQVSTLHLVILTFTALMLGLAAGYLLFARADSSGAYFCCESTAPCYYSPDGDCSVPLTWCSVTRRLSDGTVTCAQW